MSEYKIKGRLYMEEMVENKERRFGAWKFYYPVIVVDAEGNEKPALFTEHAINEALERASRNLEDLPEEEKRGLFSWLFTF